MLRFLEQQQEKGVRLEFPFFEKRLSLNKSAGQPREDTLWEAKRRRFDWKVN
jgi:hypothetical protein